MLSLIVMFYAHSLQPALVCRSVRLDMKRLKEEQKIAVDDFFRDRRERSEGTLEKCKLCIPERNIDSPENIQFIVCFDEKAAELGFHSAVHEGHFHWWTK
jgi:hypothetical protein